MSYSETAGASRSIWRSSSAEECVSFCIILTTMSTFSPFSLLTFSMSLVNCLWSALIFCFSASHSPVMSEKENF